MDCIDYRRLAVTRELDAMSRGERAAIIVHQGECRTCEDWLKMRGGYLLGDRAEDIGDILQADQCDAEFAAVLASRGIHGIGCGVREVLVPKPKIEFAAEWESRWRKSFVVFLTGIAGLVVVGSLYGWGVRDSLITGMLWGWLASTFYPPWKKVKK